MANGKYIVIDGISGIGKSTTIARLAHDLQAAQVPVQVFASDNQQFDIAAQTLQRITDDRRYGFSTTAAVLLRNAAGAQELAVLQKALAAGITCIADHSYLTILVHEYYGRGDIGDYTAASQIAQYALGRPQPDLLILLDAPASAVKSRLNTDQQASFDETYQERVRAGYLWEAKQRNLPVVYATEPVDTIFNTIRQQVSSIIPIPHENTPPAADIQTVDLPAQTTVTEPTPAGTADDSTQQSSYHIPADLNGEALSQYATIMDELLATHDTLVADLTKYLLSTTPKQEHHSKADTEAQARTILRSLLPVAAVNPIEITEAVIPQPNQALQKIAADVLPTNHTQSDPPDMVTLTSYTPRNELDIIANILYTQSDLPLATLQRTAASIPYQRKVNILTTYLGDIPADSQTDGSVLGDIRYDFDIVSSYSAFHTLQKQPIFRHALRQTLSPRLGYDTPQAVEKAGLSDAFAHSFDRSLELYSALQTGGFTHDTEYAALLGHKLRWSITLTAYNILHLPELQTTPQVDQECQGLLQLLLSKVAEIHAVLTGALHISVPDKSSPGPTQSTANA